MADFPQMKLQQRISQNMTQVQTQKMSQTQIMSLNLLNMSSADLRNEIYKKAAENPALEIISDSLESGAKNAVVTSENHFSDNLYYGKASKAGLEASDNFQAALESNADFREVLSDHLEHQLNSMPLSDEETDLCKRLIYNLNDKGFHLLSPSSLMDRSNPHHTEDFLEHCMKIVQKLDPVGTCVSNFEESLYVQATILGNASKCTLFLLKHFDFLNPAQVPKIQKKIKSFIAEQEKLKFSTFKPFDCDEEDIQESLDYIRRLDPFPAKEFGSSQTGFVFPDIKIEFLPFSDSDNSEASSNESKGEISVSLTRDFIPKISVARDYEELVSSTKIKDGDTSEKAERQKAELKFARASINDAKAFIESIQYRESTALKAAKVIASVQKEFFIRGPRYLSPLRQKDVAEAIGVHETTISRMANSKYLECKWGIFPVSYFFTNALPPQAQQEVQGGSLSKEAVKAEISVILDEHKNDKKALSDQKLCDALSEKGIKIARRTVAKYRAELNISSSYER